MQQQTEFYIQVMQNVTSQPHTVLYGILLDVTKVEAELGDHK
jgi:hypothetical protein